MPIDSRTDSKATSKGPEGSPQTASASNKSPRLCSSLVLWTVTAMLCSVVVSHASGGESRWRGLGTLFSPPFEPVAREDLCPQYVAIFPEIHAGILQEIENEYLTKDFEQKMYESLSGAIQIPTVVHDDYGPPDEEPGWAVFGKLHGYFETRFPLVHQHLRRTTVNSFGLVYHWKGKNATLKPMLLTGHQDVVPVEPITADQWTYPPFSGQYDGEWIHGRGAIDCKAVLISHLTAVEMLLQKGFQPARTVVLGYGFDEERGGIIGASRIAEYLEAEYGRDGFALLVDESSPNPVSDDMVMAVISPAEKGVLVARMEINTPGGHGGLPPPHTGIGMLGTLITELERNHPVPRLVRESTYYETLQCKAAHDPGMSETLRTLLKDSQKSDRALKALAQELSRSDPTFSALAGTTQSISMVSGGAKSGALPEHAEIVVDYLVDSPLAEIRARLATVAAPVAHMHNLSLTAWGTPFGDVEEGHGYGHMRLSDAFAIARDVSPVAPTFGSGPWEFLSGTIKGTFSTANRSGHEDKPVFVAPGLLIGITDTGHYWNLTKHIYRYVHVMSSDARGAHTVNEGGQFVFTLLWKQRLLSPI